MRKEKCLAVYEPPTQGATYFLNWVSQIIDFHSIRYEKQVIIENFNLTPDNESIREFVDLYNLTNLIKTTCIKGKGYCIDLLLTNEKDSFKNTNTFKTGLTDHYLLIY